MENLSIHSMHNMKIVTSKLYDPINICFTRYNFKLSYTICCSEFWLGDESIRFIKKRLTAYLVLDTSYKSYYRSKTRLGYQQQKREN